MPSAVSALISRRSISSLRCAAVIMTKQMQHAMDDEMGRVTGQRLALLARFPGYQAAGEHDIAKKGAAAAGWCRRCGNDRTLVGSSNRRHRRLSARTVASFASIPKEGVVRLDAAAPRAARTAALTMRSGAAKSPPGPAVDIEGNGHYGLADFALRPVRRRLS